jgi:hypothetical protein
MEAQSRLGITRRPLMGPNWQVESISMLLPGRSQESGRCCWSDRTSTTNKDSRPKNLGGYSVFLDLRQGRWCNLGLPEACPDRRAGRGLDLGDSEVPLSGAHLTTHVILSARDSVTSHVSHNRAVAREPICNLGHA